MTMEHGFERADRRAPSKASADRAVEYQQQREEEGAKLGERLVAVQRRLNELKADKERGARVATERHSPELEDLAILLRKAVVDEMEQLENEREELEEKMRSKGIDPAKYIVQ